MMNRNLAPAAVAALLVGIAIITSRSAQADSSRLHTNTSSVDKTVCKTVKKNGKKVRQCHLVVPKPTPTPTTPPVPYSWKATMVPCGTNAKGTGCSDLHFTLTQQDNGVITLSQKELGYTLDFSRFGIVKADSLTGPATYNLTMYVKAGKSTPKDGALDSWAPGTYGTLSVTAANAHPYSASSCRIPAFPSTTLYNGEHSAGWVCSTSIPGEYMESTFTWSVSLPDRFVTPYSSYTFPVVAVEVHRK